MDDSPADLGRAALRAGRRPRPFRRGEHLITAGTRSDEVLLLESGLVKVVLPAVGGREPITGLYGAGTLLGEIGVTSGGPRSAHVIVLIAGAAWHVASSHFLALADDAGVRRLLEETWRTRQRKADENQLRQTCTGAARVAMCLLTWAREFGIETGSGLELHGVSQQDLAHAVAMSVKSIEPFLHTLRGRGLLRTSRLCFLLPSPERLGRFIAYADGMN
ncbi:Crp/Fnr family transcriptional regulator [Lentzea jiangxiensis]|uniref:cAMP-binding domain of CRP or a regulatory subunit of cAMP-dependent protein kinases n=1 Tax=Lentzea jiangxiensis TaxID=641025 RepID=A0A1H0MK48_9PSEU|nr:Crp/Fnr family transcriptional regulator [Lentzea jiangxiensis]SDO80705.1 cAMP-binding domain of CRP or a regulatory subunit of cAMP-dependent protein kinases [Lentzea jiangxiensis]